MIALALVHVALKPVVRDFHGAAWVCLLCCPLNYVDIVIRSYCIHRGARPQDSSWRICALGRDFLVDWLCHLTLVTSLPPAWQAWTLRPSHSLSTSARLGADVFTPTDQFAHR